MGRDVVYVDYDIRHDAYDTTSAPTPMRTARAAAYTRTPILQRFLDQLSQSPPARVNTEYAQERLRLKGGDIRAFLQACRVLGLIDGEGRLTERARRMRGLAERPRALREALEEAYPDLMRLWRRGENRTRPEVEDYFKLQYGLSAYTAGPAAKLFLDLIPLSDLITEASESNGAQSAVESRPSSVPAAVGSGSERPAGSAPPEDARLAAMQAVQSAVRVNIDGQWDAERINLVFDRLEGLVRGILSGGER
ncbi:MAG: DUF5343 domain-containing protein [Armatimonadetes bacterium]|nr:DUF5343 domain-containing protein [Armatimonadota bacterium]